MFLAIGLALSLVVLTFIFHYHVLLWLGSFTPKLRISTHMQVLVMVISLFFAHVVEIGFYAIMYGWSIEGLGLGFFEGARVDEFMSYLYYSGVIYTSLGLGDIYPEGHIRFISAIETLNGLLLISWSASFTFVAMGRLWPWDNCFNITTE